MGSRRVMSSTIGVTQGVKERNGKDVPLEEAGSQWGAFAGRAGREVSPCAAYTYTS